MDKDGIDDRSDGKSPANDLGNQLAAFEELENDFAEQTKVDERPLCALIRSRSPRRF